MEKTKGAETIREYVAKIEKEVGKKVNNSGFRLVRLNSWAPALAYTDDVGHVASEQVKFKIITQQMFISGRDQKRGSVYEEA